MIKVLLLYCFIYCFIYKTIHGNLFVDNSRFLCKNDIVNDYESPQTILNEAKKYYDYLHNKTTIEKRFTGAYKFEPERILGSSFLPQCRSMKLFGSEKHNFDEVKRFCFMERQTNRTEPCVVFSIGSNNQWFFELNVFKESNCMIETFDCTTNATIPTHIKSRTRFHPYCLSKTSNLPTSSYKTLQELIALTGRTKGPDYLKMDIEGYEWGVLQGFIETALVNGHDFLPKQIYAEFHLDREQDEDGNYIHHMSGVGAYVGQKLNHFFKQLFLKAGYMIMHRRLTVQTRTSDMLLVKLFCPPS